MKMRIGRRERGSTREYGECQWEKMKWEKEERERGATERSRMGEPGSEGN